MRRRYLDWLRGIGVLIMIEAHVVDSWTLVSERERVPFGYAIILGGFGAPIFLFLAGIAIALACGSRVRKGKSPREAAAAARRRGWEIFVLAFLFRLQSWVLSGAPAGTLLKVDILNIMGLAMVGAATLWGVGRTHLRRAVLLVAAAVALTMLTPIVRASGWVAALPDPVEWYMRPYPDRTTFTLFPWAGFLFAGAAIGLWVDAARTEAEERRLNVTLGIAGPAIAFAGYSASYLPPIYAQTNFWTSSPTFFFLRLGVLVSLLPLAYAWERRPSASRDTRWNPLEDFGRSSLFVYWIHVEMVYGVLSAGIHKRLTFEQSLAAFAVFSLFLFAIAKGKNWIEDRMKSRGVARGSALATREG
jgi:uncharacterized membrane protein